MSGKDHQRPRPGTETKTPDLSGITSEELFTFSNKLTERAIATAKKDMVTDCPPQSDFCKEEERGPSSNIILGGEADKTKEILESARRELEKRGILEFQLRHTILKSPPSSEAPSLSTPQDAFEVVVHPRPTLVTQFPSQEVIPNSSVRRFTLPLVESTASVMDSEFHLLKKTPSKSDLREGLSISTIASSATVNGNANGLEVSPLPLPSQLAAESVPDRPHNYPPLSEESKKFLREHIRSIQVTLNSVKRELAEYGFEFSDPPSRK